MHITKHEVHLNLNVRGLPVSATLGINEQSNRLIAEGITVYKLGLGQSPGKGTCCQTGWRFLSIA
ncbi:MAG: hypothetical protein K0A94_02440 [Desulfuromonadales bacterium]|nr:hypothetical protein [Desulfuromonadales bacterium]